MKNRFERVIFDFDYTLANSSQAVVECVNFAFGRLELPCVSAEPIRRTIGLPLSETFRKLAGRQHNDRCDEFIRLFYERAEDVMVDWTVVLESVPGTIGILKEYGIALGIVSTKFRFRIEAILRRENLLESFEVIVGGEDVSEHKPDPEGLLKVVHLLDSAPARCLYVGDSITDAKTAVRAQVPFAAVLSGVTTKDDFKSYPVYGIVEDLSELPALMGC